MIFLILPRLGITIALGIVGCEYLAHTVSLNDIVLNSLALAFVIEVDELVAEVLLNRKLKTTVENVKPIAAGKPCKIGAYHVGDLLRYALATALLVFACFYWLAPFAGNVEAAAMALCAGNTKFSQTGGSTELSTIVLLKNDDFVSECSKNFFQETYLPNAYSGVNRSGPKKTLAGRSSSLSSQDIAEKRKKATLQYAYSSCPKGQIARVSDGECETISEQLVANLPDGVDAGGNAEPPTCPRFQPGQEGAACNKVKPPESCWWTWRGFTCEQGLPPGYLRNAACASDLTNFQQLD